MNEGIDKSAINSIAVTSESDDDGRIALYAAGINYVTGLPFIKKWNGQMWAEISGTLPSQVSILSLYIYIYPLYMDIYTKYYYNPTREVYSVVYISIFSLY